MSEQLKASKSQIDRQYEEGEERSQPQRVVVPKRLKKEIGKNLEKRPEKPDHFPLAVKQSGSESLTEVISNVKQCITED